MMQFNKKSTRSEFWKEVIKLSLIILAILVAVFTVAIVATLIVKSLGPWAILLFAVVFIFLCSYAIVYSEWRNR